MGSNTDMTGACTFNLNNQNYIIGGKDHRRQVQLNKITVLIFEIFKISVLSGCSLQRVSDMPLDSEYSTCASFDINNTSFALICFAREYRQTCYKYVFIY